MKIFLRILLLSSIFIILQCENSEQQKSSIKGDDFIIHKFNCNGSIYFSLENGTCEKLPKDYFRPIGNSENYFELAIRKKKNKNKIEIYSLTNDFKTSENIKENVEIFTYQDWKSNIFWNDSIVKNPKFIIVNGTISN